MNQKPFCLKVMIGFYLFLFVFVGCTSTEKPAEPKSVAEKPDNLESIAKEVKEEKEMGRLMAAKLLGFFGPYAKDRAALKYLNLVGRNLTQQIGRIDINWYFGILDTEEINAFACPGGYVFVTRGLLKAVKTEHELADVLAHEIVHINEKHMFNEIRKKREVSAGETLTRILSRGSSDLGANMVKLVEEGLKKLLEKGYDKEKEYEADALGAVYAQQVGYNPNGLVDLLSRLSQSSPTIKDNKTHPPYDERISKLKEVISSNGLKPSEKPNAHALGQRFSQFLGRLDQAD